METFSGHVGFLINGDTTWVFVFIAIVSLGLAKFSLNEDIRVAPTMPFFDPRAGALTYGGMMSMAIVSILFGAFIDESMSGSVLIFLLATLIGIYPFYKRADSILLNAQYPDGGLEPHEH